jgi:hypothetical protein
MDPKELADRTGITLTLLLTSVAFKFVISSYLPAVTYQARMSPSVGREENIQHDHMQTHIHLAVDADACEDSLVVADFDGLVLRRRLFDAGRGGGGEWPPGVDR